VFSNLAFNCSRIFVRLFRNLSFSRRNSLVLGASCSVSALNVFETILCIEYSSVSLSSPDCSEVFKWLLKYGRGFATSGGYYGANGKQVFGNGKLTVKSGSFFYGSSSSWKNGNSYFDGTKSSWVTGKQRISD